MLIEIPTALIATNRGELRGSLGGGQISKNTLGGFCVTRSLPENCRSGAFALGGNQPMPRDVEEKLAKLCAP